ncbi:hypothetical protein FHS18_003899 [Paenibacillus phyllosphaerae]|uniref:Uncharacterized protein n=1 Tax=Paenibacillus phyllosphaerae TaxID=274593 RepID=A0A7W5B185_9BACL|nr:hypothetical protein [Paenibacillus phyllosphaerae]MBB3111831.1 hypothetical protein [Paenibacillus phyllosphaerae]
MAQIQVAYTSIIDRAFVLHGKLLEGKLVPGSSLYIPLDRYSQLAGAVSRVEYQDDAKLWDIVIVCPDHEEAELLEMLIIHDEVLEVA